MFPNRRTGSDRVRRFARTAKRMAQATPEQMIPEFEKNVANGLFSYDPPAAIRAVWTLYGAHHRPKGLRRRAGAMGGCNERAARGGKGRHCSGAGAVSAKRRRQAIRGLPCSSPLRSRRREARAGQSVQALRLLKRTTSGGEAVLHPESGQQRSGGAEPETGRIQSAADHH